MRILSEIAAPPLVVRTTACDCGREECDTQFVIAAVAEKDLWITTAFCALPEQVEAEVAILVENEPDDDVCAADIVARGVAVFGVTWRALRTGGAMFAAKQLLAFDRAPEWIDRVPVEELMRVRGCVFGDDLTRVPRALQALRDAYDPGGRPARGAWLS